VPHVMLRAMKILTIKYNATTMHRFKSTLAFTAACFVLAGITASARRASH
jgi:hypothetical protein